MTLAPPRPSPAREKLLSKLEFLNDYLPKEAPFHWAKRFFPTYSYFRFDSIRKKAWPPNFADGPLKRRIERTPSWLQEKIFPSWTDKLYFRNHM